MQTPALHTPCPRDLDRHCVRDAQHPDEDVLWRDLCLPAPRRVIASYLQHLLHTLRPAVAAIRAIDPEQPVGTMQAMVQVLDRGLGFQRFSVLLLGVFAGVALLLAAVGIYSLLSCIVRGRSREIGIRTALGARTADVLRLVIVEGMSPTLVGIAAGTIAALASASVMQTLVFGVSASDPLTLAAVAATLAFVALMACLVPAYRALRLDPGRALRAD